MAYVLQASKIVLSLTETVEKSLRAAALWDEVKDRLHESALRLSGGQMQRLCIARAIAVQPDIILMDEPCSALDPIATSHIEDLIDELKQEYTVIIVTHNMQQAARVSDYTAFLYLGELIEFDETNKMFHDALEETDPGLHHRTLWLIWAPHARSHVRWKEVGVCLNISCVRSKR